MNGSSSELVSGTPGSQSTFEQTELQRSVVENEKNVASSMPNYKEAITPKEKFLNYSLDYDNPKAKGKAEAYEKGLGYTQKNAEGLIKQIHNYVSSGNPPDQVTQTQYGTKYKYRIPVTGPNGKTKIVVAVYQIDNGSTTPRLITNYLEAKKND